MRNMVINENKCKELQQRFYNLFRRDANFHDKYNFVISRDKELLFSYNNDDEYTHLLKLEAKGII